MITERNVHARNIVAWAKDKPEVVVLSGDLTSQSEAHLFRDAYPDRFLSMGIAEQNMHSFAGGLASEGYVPFIHTFAVFIYRRALDQVAMSIAYPNRKVRLVGFLPGVTSPAGATHQSLEDVSVMRALPNMTVLEPGDATEVETILDVTSEVDGPVYIRMPRGVIPRLFESPMELGKSRTLTTGKDVVLISSGLCTREAIAATEELRGSGVDVQHMHVSTYKPFDDEAIKDAIAESKYGVVTVENHSTIGGLGSIVADMMAENGFGKKLRKLGIQDMFLHGASEAYLLAEYGIDAHGIVTGVKELIGS
jgi:transketolase